MEQLAAALTELTKFQQEQQRRLEETQRQQEERRREEEELGRQQQEEYQVQVKAMHEQHLHQLEVMKEALKERETSNPHLKIAPYQETEDIQDFLEAFEGIMNIQKVNPTGWVLRLTPLLSGKARTVCTDLGPTTAYNGVKTAILEHYNVNVERSRKRFRAHVWTKGQEPMDWVTKGIKLAKRWLIPGDGGVDGMVNKIAIEHFLNGLPQEMRIWVASHDPETPEKVAQLIEAYDSAHSRQVPANERASERTRRYHPDPKYTATPSKKEFTSRPQQKKPLAEMTCFKCNRKGHLARHCTEQNLRVREESEKMVTFGEGKVNGQPVQRIQIDSGASRTVVDRRLVPFEEIGKETITVTFGNGTSGEYPLAPVPLMGKNTM